MLILRFIEYTLKELFRKPGNWRQIFKQTNSIFYTSNDVSLKCVEKEKLLGCHNKIALKIAFAK